MSNVKAAEDKWKEALEVSASWNSVANRRRDAWRAAPAGPAAERAKKELAKAVAQHKAAKEAEIAAWSLWVDARDEAA